MLHYPSLGENVLQPTPGPHKRGHKSTAPRPHERRAAGAYPYYRVAEWRPELLSFKDHPKPFESRAAAKAHAKAKYECWKVSRISEDGSVRVVDALFPQELSEEQVFGPGGIDA